MLNLNEYSEQLMDDEIVNAVILNGTVSFQFKDGHTECRNYEEKKKGCKHTEEYKDYMSRLMKKNGNTERNVRNNDTEKSKDNSCNNK